MLAGVIILLQPVSQVRADTSAQDKEVLTAVEKVAPTVEEIAGRLWDLSEVSLLEIKSSFDHSRVRAALEAVDAPQGVVILAEALARLLPGVSSIEPGFLGIRTTEGQ